MRKTLDGEYKHWLRCRSLLAVTGFLLRDDSVLPKMQLHWVWTLGERKYVATEANTPIYRTSTDIQKRHLRALLFCSLGKDLILVEMYATVMEARYPSPEHPSTCKHSQVLGFEVFKPSKPFYVSRLELEDV